jgi:tubulin monoglycylase TTLL3/8
MIDSGMKMWLLEVNKCPTMEYSTSVTAKLVPMMLQDLVKVIVDWKDAKNNSAPTLNIDTGLYE